MLLSSLLSLLAVLALAALNAWLGRSGRLGRDPGAPSARLALDLIDFTEREGEAANDGRAWAALGATPTDLAVAVAIGDSWATRRLGPGSLRQVSLSGTTLTLRAHDFTLPVMRLAFTTEAAAARWERRFAAITAASSSAVAVEPASVPQQTRLEQTP